MLLKCFVLLCTVVSCLSKRRIGGRCLFKEDVAGTCQPITECPYALTLLYVEERKPPMCWWEGETRIVCCPSNDNEFRLGLYDSLGEGVLRSGSTICRYEGEWHHCRPIEPERPPLDETGCPPLDKPAPPPTLSPVQLIAWNKCVENLRFVDQCIAEPGDRDSLIRRYECGIQDQPFRIAGGRDAGSKEFPHMVALGVAEKRVEDSTFNVAWVAAAGALVSDRFVLTAAHVLIDPNGRPLRYALMGSLDKDVRSGLLLTIVRRIPHPLYRWSNNQHDIALLELDRPVPLSSLVRPICLPVPGQDTDRDTQRLHIAYWVRTGDSANATELLNTAQVSLLDYSECQTKLGSFQYNSSTMLCVKGSNRGTGRKIIAPNTCPGDSGGPLMSVLSNVKCSYRVDGVLSFGPKCGGGSASVYTPVGRYLDWIVRNVWPEEWKLRLTDESHIIHFP